MINPIKTQMYKLVCVQPDGKRVSFNKTIQQGKLAVTYSEGKLIRPKVGKIFVFDNILCAKAHYRYMSKIDSLPTQLWLVEAYGTKRANTVLYVFELSASTRYAIENCKQFWASKQRDGHPQAPAGTYLCSSLRLIKEVPL